MTSASVYPPHVVYLETARYMKRTERGAAKMLARYLDGKASARAWARAERAASIAKRQHWAAEQALATSMKETQA